MSESAETLPGAAPAGLKNWIKDNTVSLGLIVMGLTLLRVSSDPAMLAWLGGDLSLAPSIGSLWRESGSVRIRPASSAIWRDVVSGKQELSDGDTVFTSDQSVARVSLQNASKEAMILPNSLVVIHASNASSADIKYDIRKGGIHITGHDLARVHIQAHGRDVVPKPRQEKEDFDILVDENAASMARIISSLDPPPAPASATPPAPAPVPVAPLKMAEPVALSPAENQFVFEAKPVERPLQRILPTFQIGDHEADTRLGSDGDLYSVRLNLSWSPLKEAQKYVVELFRGDKLIKSGDTKNAKYPLIITQAEEKLAFRVSARLKTGELVQSDMIPIGIKFSPPIPKSPENAHVYKPNDRILMTWEKTSLTPAYEFQIATDREFKTTVHDIKSRKNFYVFQSPTVAPKYYWRVRAGNGEKWSPWSDVREFGYSPERAPAAAQ